LRENTLFGVAMIVWCFVDGDTVFGYLYVL
jgi:hypothetical protein